MRALFVSDVHVSAARPGAVSALIALLGAAKGRIDALYVLGDLFDQWLGDDDRTAPYPEVETALKTIADAGARVSAHHGNHDFLLGTAFAERVGCAIVAEQELIDLDGVSTLLLHGDILCTDDREYQAYRAHTRVAAHQAAFLSLPFPQREAQALALRQSAAELKQLKSDDIMDVNTQAVVQLLDETGAARIIHGHTHRPAVHTVDGNAHPRERIVLGDWYQGSGKVALHERAGEVCLMSAQEAADRLTRG